MAVCAEALNAVVVHVAFRVHSVQTVHERAVVAGVNDDGVFSDAGIIDRFQNLSDRPVDLSDEVSIRAELRRSLKTIRRPDGLMRSGQREVQKEGSYLFTIRIDWTHDVFKGHFPGHPVMPGALLVDLIINLPAS